LTGAGVPAETAEHYAGLYESAFGTMAERAGVDPVQLFESYGLKVERPSLTESDGNNREVSGKQSAGEPTFREIQPGPEVGEPGAGGSETLEEPSLESTQATPIAAESLAPVEEIPGLADLEASLGGASLETLDQEGRTVNASGESGASAEAMS